MTGFNSVDFVWDTCIEFLYDKELYAESISELLKEQGAKKILDCSCGTGFPSIQLAKRGFNVTASDASSRMLSRFRKNMEKEKLSIPFFKLKWNKLDSFFDSGFDAVLCRGNSLPYAVSWEKNSVDLEKARKEIFVSLKNMFNLLKENGFLYVDLSPRESFSPLNTVFIHKFRPKEIDGKTVLIDWKITHFLDKGKRIWNANLLVKETKKNFSLRFEGYHLRHAELLSILKEVGFKRIFPYVDIEGEKTYDVFLAFK
ncbi:MAG: class I SAM-dependent methyltransferase [archaeon]